MNGPTAREIYEGSDGEATKAFYARLEALGPAGFIAANLFRACKCSDRAKAYSRKFKGEAYGRKQWSLQNLDRALTEHAESLGIAWGWKRDPKQNFHCWVLYADIPTGQASFHTAARLSAKDYPGEWDGLGGSPARTAHWCDILLGQPDAAQLPPCPGRTAAALEPAETFTQPSLL